MLQVPRESRLPACTRYFMRICHGVPYPLGATFDGSGVNFSLFSSVAERVELCLFNEQGQESRFDLPGMTAFCWHGYVPGLQPGQRYGFRVHGPWEPRSGLRCNAAKLLLDPYAKSIEGQVQWNEALFSHCLTSPFTIPNERDSGPYAPKSVVIDPCFDWEGDKPLRTAWDATVIYEAHLKGFTVRHSQIPGDLQGSYLGLAHPKAIAHLKRLGVTAIELLPIHQFVHDLHLLERGRRNYWGYNTIGFFAPHNEYGTKHSGQPVREFKQMVKTLHEAGLEVILDVVYGHTAEGNHLGPVLCFKGIDNPTYYRLVEGDSFYYVDYTGTGNSLNTRQPWVLQLLMDSLRYWLTEMHVDGFRFDLAPALARGVHDVDPLSAFFDVIQQDPVVSQAKLIAEPWDASDRGYQLGQFPPLWSEWNGKYRDSLRDFWRGANDSLREFASRVSGSPDLYGRGGRSPSASINFVTAHDGFTLLDLVSYDAKHNEANGEWNLDGDNCNRSWNCGVEGPTCITAINELRRRQKRNLMATLVLSRGVPMLLAGDEIGRAQNGNNNAYCQDNEISWLDWEHVDCDFLSFVAGILRLRREHPVLHSLSFLCPDAGWYRNDGQPMSLDDWKTDYAKAVGMFVCGPVDGVGVDRFYAAFNAHCETLEFRIPGEYPLHWSVVLNTLDPRPLLLECPLNGVTFSVAGRSLLLLHSSGDEHLSTSGS